MYLATTHIVHVAFFSHADWQRYPPSLGCVFRVLLQLANSWKVCCCLIVIDLDSYQPPPPVPWTLHPAHIRFCLTFCIAGKLHSLRSYALPVSHIFYPTHHPRLSFRQLLTCCGDLLSNGPTPESSLSSSLTGQWKEGKELANTSSDETRSPFTGALAESGGMDIVGYPRTPTYTSAVHDPHPLCPFFSHRILGIVDPRDLVSRSFRPVNHIIRDGGRLHLRVRS